MLAQPTLVLNKHWVAIQTTTVRNALCLMCTGAARAIDPETYEIHDFASWIAVEASQDEPGIVGVHARIRVPDIILLTRYGQVPRRHVSFSRRNLYRRDGFTCQYCGNRASADQLTIDHVMPRSRGGLTSWENCVVACGTCNRRKGDRTPEEARMKLRRRPAPPRWTPYVQLDATPKPSWAKFVGPQRSAG